MDPQPIEIALCTCNAAAIRCALLAARSRDADVVATADRKTIDDIDRGDIQVFPIRAEHRNHGEQQLFDAMQAAIEATGAKHAPHIALFVQKGAGQGVIPAEEEHRHQGNGHNFGVGDVALDIVAMTQANHQIGTQRYRLLHYARL